MMITCSNSLKSNWILRNLCCSCSTCKEPFCSVLCPGWPLYPLSRRGWPAGSPGRTRATPPPPASRCSSSTSGSPRRWRGWSAPPRWRGAPASRRKHIWRKQLWNWDEANLCWWRWSLWLLYELYRENDERVHKIGYHTQASGMWTWRNWIKSMICWILFLYL